MKKNTVIFLAAAIAAIFLSIFSIQTARAAGKKVMATFFPLYVHALNIVGDRSSVEVLLPPGVGVHEFSPRPSDIQKMASAGVVIANGAGLDEFVDRMIESSGNTGIIKIDASYGVELISTQGGCSECAEHGHAGEHEEKGVVPDSHTWLSAANAVRQVANIADGLCRADTENIGFYKANAAAYIKRLEELDAFAKAALAPFKNKRFIIYHGPFSYFARDYGLVQTSIAGMSGGAPSPSKLKEIYETIKNEKIKFMVSEPAYQDREIKAISEELKLEVIEMDPVESYKEGAALGNYFLDKMKSNVEKLSAAFKSSAR